MTAELRAVRVVEEWGGFCDRKGRERLIELIRVALVQAASAEMEKRRAADQQVIDTSKTVVELYKQLRELREPKTSHSETV